MQNAEFGFIWSWIISPNENTKKVRPNLLLYNCCSQLITSLFWHHLAKSYVFNVRKEKLLCNLLGFICWVAWIAEQPIACSMRTLMFLQFSYFWLMRPSYIMRKIIIFWYLNSKNMDVKFILYSRYHTLLIRWYYIYTKFCSSFK